MSALFGHTKGAFTGAVTARPGLLRSADRGVLFLDEIGELGGDEQAMLLKAIEEKRFLPVGMDREMESDFQLICGSNRDLQQECARGNFRNDLLARINLWSFELPGLCNRKEDIEPNFDYELERFCRRSGNRVTINKEARQAFLTFATSEEALWRANFRDLGGAVTRMATLSTHGRITVDQVQEEIGNLRKQWHGAGPPDQNKNPLEGIINPQDLEDIDLFDRHTLAKVVEVCRSSTTMADAGRRLFNISRCKKSTTNDSDRLRKYLAKFDLTWKKITQR